MSSSVPKIEDRSGASRAGGGEPTPAPGDAPRQPLGANGVRDALVDLAGAIVIVLDEAGKLTEVNRFGCELLGYRRDELVGKLWVETAIPPACRQRVRGAHAAALADQVRPSCEIPVVTKSGVELLVLWRNTPLYGLRGGVVGVICTGLDMSEQAAFREERRRVEDELEASVAARTLELSRAYEKLQHEMEERLSAQHRLEKNEQRFRLLAENARDVVYRYRFVPRRGFEYVSPAASAITGYAPAEFYADPELGLKIVDPRDREMVARHERGGSYPGDPFLVRWMRKDGSLIWAELKTVPIHDDQGRIVAMEGIARDVTARKQAEDSLRAAREDCERRMEERTAELLRANELLRRETTERLEAESALRGSEQRYHNMFELAAVCLSEQDFSLLRAAIMALKEQGVTDIRSYMAQHPEFAQQGVRVVKILDVNDRALRVFRAQRKQELLGPVDGILQPEALEVFSELIAAIAEGHAYFEAEIAARTLRGERLKALMSLRIPAHAAESESVLVSFVDLTEQQLNRRYMEMVLSAQDEERRRMARELHDETGQALTSIAVGLQELREVGSLELAHRISGRLQGIAETTVDEIGRLARGLHPYLLDDLGFAEALQRHVADLAKHAGIYIDLAIAGLASGTEPPKTIATALYRIVQEALTNVLRHAEARNVSVVITWTPTHVRTVIEDDGRGFDSTSLTDVSSSTVGLGLHGMRERLALLNGTLEIESAPGEGTALLVQIPR